MLSRRNADTPPEWISGARMRVLIIDDSAVMRKIVEGALRHAGLHVEVLEAANGLEGLAALEQAAAQGKSLDLILCDVHMPGLDGLGFLLETPKRNLASGVPVVMITADAADPYLLRAIAAGADGYISKPFTLREVQASLSAVLGIAAAAVAAGGAETGRGGAS
jgi:two-component system chemotaxis response regulator CheY